jgi:lysophospholipase L1-like esterase
MGNTAVRRRHAGFVAGLATLALTLSLEVPAQAVDKIDYYVALGDSYAAGVGAGPYLDTTCFRSENAYSEVADDLKTVKFTANVACGDATTQEVVSEQLGVLNRKTDLVTITAGGNDLGFGELATYCGDFALDPTNVAASQRCFGAIALAQNQITSGVLYEDLVTMIRSVQAAAPNAQVVLTGYPYLFEPLPLNSENPVSLFVQQANFLVAQLNATIEAAAQETGAEYVDVKDEFAGHGVFSQNPWINFFGDPDVLLHPNAEGYEAYFAAIYSEGFFN